ncbi:MAG: hypothetical protein ACHQAX_08685 [Gammaproteobacteria bacterium]
MINQYQLKQKSASSKTSAHAELNPLPALSNNEIAPVLIDVMKYGVTKRTGLFRCYYPKGQLTVNEAENLARFLESNDVFCLPTQYPNECAYLAFNKSKEELHVIFNTLCPGYESYEPGGRKNKSGCQIL